MWDIKYQAKPRRSQELRNCIHRLILFCDFLLSFALKQKYSPGMSICRKITVFARSACSVFGGTAWHSFYASQLFLFPYSILTPCLLSTPGVYSVWGDDITWKIRHVPLPRSNRSDDRVVPDVFLADIFCELKMTVPCKHSWWKQTGQCWLNTNWHTRNTCRPRSTQTKPPFSFSSRCPLRCLI